MKLYWIGAGTTDTANAGAKNLYKLTQDLKFNSTYKEIPGAHYWFIWRDFLCDFGSKLFK